MTEMIAFEVQPAAPMEAPLVSIILPIFNAGKHLRSCIRSLQWQDYANFEIIAIDDGSTDGSWDVLREYAEADPRLIVRTRENRGLIATLNEAIPLCQGDFIARMDADDIAYPERFAQQVEKIVKQLSAQKGRKLGYAAAVCAGALLFYLTYLMLRGIVH